MRRLLLLNALIFAVLAAAAALAYYGYSGTTEQTSRDRELQLMLDLAEEKVLNIEALVDDADTKLMLNIELANMSTLQKKVEESSAAVVSVFVLDDKFQFVPDGVVSRKPKEDWVPFRTWFLERIVPLLPLARHPLNVRGHYYLTQDHPYLFSFMRRSAGGRNYYIVIEDDLVHLVGRLFPQFFTLTSKRLFQVRDERGRVVYGPEYTELQDSVVAEWPFALTVDGWKLRVSQKDLGELNAMKRKRYVDSALIGGAVLVILAGLTVLGFAIRRERRLNDLKSDFISNVSHELKTPLSIISMFGEMLATGRTKNAEQAHEYSEIIWRESVRLSRLIDNVLDFAKIERGMGAYEFAETDPVEIVEKAVEYSKRRVASADMTIETTIEPELPMLNLDANAFTLAVLNLIDNAIKYAAEGKKIEVSLKRAGEARIELAVRDHGPGIDPEEHDRVFERFYRARAIRLKPIRGSGIGLALVQHIAKAHGGMASVESSLGKGSTFRISLPIDGKS